MILGLEDTFTIGEDTFFSSDSPSSSYGVTFEDDMTTGYFYAVIIDSELKVIDALHVYDVENISDKHKPCKIQITWSDNGLIASLLINNYCHAIFDFENRAGYCRNGFPETRENWCIVKERNLTDDLIKEIFKVGE
jgi:hypothetical protein